jgi:hypothetical protein
MSRIRVAERRHRPLKMGLSGVTGSGKTIGSLKIAYGLTGDWTKICLIDSENKSADLYADLGSFSKIDLTDCSPQGYEDAIKEVEAAGFEVCIIDSLSHEWLAALDLHGKVTETSLSKNSFNAWNKVTPIHDSFINSWLKTPMHIIGTLRQKDEYILEQNEKGKTVPRKVGLKSIQRDGVGFEFDLWFVISDTHFCSVEKDRTRLFDGKNPFMLSEEIGKQLLNWSQSGKPIDIEIPIYQRLTEKVRLIADPDRRLEASKVILEHRNNNEMLLKCESHLNKILEGE